MENQVKLKAMLTTLMHRNLMAYGVEEELDGVGEYDREEGVVL